MNWNRATKSVVIISTLAAAFTELYLASPSLTGSWPFTIAVSLVAAVAAVRARSVAIRIVLVAIYLAPATFLLVSGVDHPSFEITWIAPLVVILVWDRDAWTWRLPAPLRLPLATWALLVSVSWPILLLREVDFSHWLLTFNEMPSTGGGVSPSEVVIWLSYATLAHNVGLLWIDTLYGWYGGAPNAKFRREIIVPLLTGAGIACVVGAYQGFVDITFLSGHVWPSMNRATGTFMDANAFGTIAALMGPAAVVLAMTARARWSLPVAGLSLILAFLGVWTSGSRSALAALLGSFGVMVYEGWIQSRSSRRPAAGRAILIGVIIAIVAIAALAARSSATATVFHRIPSLIPGLQADTPIEESLWSWWQRNGYGTTAMRMIVEHPLQGVGVGSFHTLVHDYSTLVTNNPPLASDNAQNWYRHLFAELGLLGSLPWIWWCLIFIRRLMTDSATEADRFSIRVLRSPLIAFGLIAMLSMAGQSLTVILTFWTLAYWFLAIREPGSAAAGTDLPTWKWASVIALVVVHASLTLAAARGDLLPRHRAERFGWDYSGGISDLEKGVNGKPGRRWTGLRSINTILVRGRVLKFVGWIDHPDADAHPVHVRLWADDKIVYDGDLKRTDQIHLDISPGAGQKYLILETEISRTFRPSQFGGRDRRDLGLAVQDWQWQ